MSSNIWEGQLVRLRAIEPEDWEVFFAWDQDTETAREAYWIPFLRSREATRKWTDEQALKQPENDEVGIQIETLDGTLVGSLNTHSCSARNGTFSYGIAVAPDHRRKGYASEAIILLLGYYFQELRYQKAWAMVYSFNEASIKLHMQLGFQPEGHLRRMVYTQGQYHDEVVFGMTREEFARKYLDSGG